MAPEQNQQADNDLQDGAPAGCTPGCTLRPEIANSDASTSADENAAADASACTADDGLPIPSAGGANKAETVDDGTTEAGDKGAAADRGAQRSSHLSRGTAADAPADPDLARLVHRWPSLPPAIKAAIRALVDAAE